LIEELAVGAQFNIPYIHVLVNNAYLGLIRQSQRAFDMDYCVHGERLQGELRWKGMVIGASEGTEVKAIADGRVILADWLQGYGL
ncbi:thiamine pyrophosphate-dependent enzyme, partial [Salmonella enterica subsp. enterica serovar Anatum]|nr:thiamine pyrophosphate-dependent enzyme [Salmonella enterica subsp. enterica serovar Anatum]